MSTERFAVTITTTEYHYGVVGHATTEAGAILVAHRAAKASVLSGIRVWWSMLVDSPNSSTHGRFVRKGDFINP